MLSFFTELKEQGKQMVFDYVCSLWYNRSFFTWTFSECM